MAAKEWIADGEKYALVGLGLKVDNTLPTGLMGPGLWLHTAQSFEVPDHWSKWLGTIRTGELEHCNVFLLTKTPSQTPGVLDGETQQLQQTAYYFYGGY